MYVKYGASEIEAICVKCDTGLAQGIRYDTSNNSFPGIFHGDTDM